MVYTIDELRSKILPIVQEYQIHTVYLFGSYARGTATENSDVDILIDTDGSCVNDLLMLGGLYSDLEDALQKSIDLVTVASISQPTSKRSQLHFRENMLRERIPLYVAA